MQNIVAIIKAHGGLKALKTRAIRVNPPCDGLMRLCVECIGKGPRGGAAISIAHYYEQNGDLMRDPDVVVEVPNGDDWGDASQWGAVSFDQDGGVPVRMDATNDPRVAADILMFLPDWDRNIGDQGYVEAFQKQRRGPGGG